MNSQSPLAIPTDNADAIIAAHNVAGPDGVLNAASHELADYVNAHYASRGIDHIPYTGQADQRAYILSRDPASLHQQAAYREQVSGMRFSPLADPQDLVTQGIRRAIFLPYIRLTDTALPSEIDWLRYGLPPEVTLRLKDKVYIHRWLVRNGFPHYTPNFITCQTPEIPKLGLKMLHKIEMMLGDLGMHGRYPLGLMIRSALSDGNYSMASLMEATQDMQIEGQAIRKGQFILKPDGKTANLQVFERAQEALQEAAAHLTRQNDPHIDRRAIMTRLLDISVSPGLCTAITDGHLHDFPFNGQYMEPGQTACTGTWSFQAAVGATSAGEISQLYLNQSQWLLRSIIGTLCKPSDMQGLYAMLNIDVMVGGALERELWQRAASHWRHQAYVSAVGCCEDDYQPRVYHPHSIIFAEVNPRDTNWTIAMKAVLQAQNKPCTVENLLKLASGQIQVLARDHWALPDSLDMQSARELLLDFHRGLSQQGEGFILRMADNPAGVIMYSPSRSSERLREIAKEAYAYLKRAQPQTT